MATQKRRIPSWLITIARSGMFGLIYIAVHVLMLYVPMPVDDVLGIIRGFIVAVIAKLSETVFYRLARELAEVTKEGE